VLWVDAKELCVGNKEARRGVGHTPGLPAGSPRGLTPERRKKRRFRERSPREKARKGEREKGDTTEKGWKSKKENKVKTPHREFPGC